MSRPVFFTIVSRNYLAYALTLMQSVARQYPDAPRYLCLADQCADDPALRTLLFETVTIDQLDLPHFQAFVFRYDIMELNTAVKPHMFAWLRARHPDAGIVYLDPDILVLRRLAAVERAFDDGALAVLTPHLNAPMDDNKYPGELEVMRSGTYNCGFVAIHAAHPRAADLMRWWSEKLEFGCFVDLEAGLFTDQKWMDLAPGLFPDVHILRDDGYNVAYWNLAQRPVCPAADGGFTAGGVPLVFAHFSGVVLGDPQRFSKHQDRFDADSIGGLRPLYDRYLGLLERNGHRSHARKPYAYGSFPDGEKIAPAIRNIYRRYFDVRCARPKPDAFTIDRALFNQPCTALPVDRRLPVSFVMYEVWRMRGDLRDVFNLDNPDGREGYIRWYLAAAGPEMGIADRYIEPIRSQFLAAHGGSGTAAAEDGSAGETASGRVARGIRYRVGRSMLAMLTWGHGRVTLQRWYARLPSRWRLAVRRRAYAYCGIHIPATLPPIGQVPVRIVESVPESLPPVPEDGPGVNLVGYARGEFGVAENVRSYARALESSQYRFLIRNFDVGVASRQLDRSMDAHFAEQLRYDDNVFFINADQMHVAHMTLGQAAFAGRGNVGFWVWELEKFPEAWAGAFDLVDEVWAPTDYVRKAIAAATRKPVLRMPKAIEFTPPTGVGRMQFGLPEDDFVFLFSYDFNSFTARKNPEAVVMAFRQAFADGVGGVRLLLKSTNGARFPRRLAELAQSVADDPRIEVRDGFLSRDDMFGLQQASDCYVSLHRAEGFGLGMAECMYLGKPVIATGYSGNLDFMDAHNSLLVDYRRIAVREGEYPHWSGQSWADPDVAHAARLMRQLFDDRERARAIGASAARSIRRTNSRAVCAAAMTARLAAIGEARAGAADRPAHGSR